MQAHASEEQVRAVCQRIESFGFKAHPIPGVATHMPSGLPAIPALVDGHWVRSFLHAGR